MVKGKKPREDGKRSYFPYEKVGKNFEPSGAKMSSKNPNSAAKKAAIRIAKATGKDVVDVFIREAGRREKVRSYKGTIVPSLVVEPNSKLNRSTRAAKQTLAAGDAMLVQRNAYYVSHPVNPKSKAPWTEEDAKERNGKLITGKFTDKAGKEYPTTIELNAGEHIVYVSKVAKITYEGIIVLPKGTKMHPESEVEDAKAEAAGVPEEKPKAVKTGGKGGKKGAAKAAPAPAAAPVAAPVA
jgi:hypothetical protein